MTRLLNAKKRLSSIGLEIDAHEFRAVQLMQSSQGINTVAWAIFPRHGEHVSAEMAELPTSEELQWGSDILSRRGFIGNAVSMTPSPGGSSSHILDLPPASSGAPIKQLARMEVARSRKCAPDDFELGYWALPAKGRTHETLAVAFPRTTIDQTIERFESAGFVPVGMDLMELAIHRGTHTPDGEVENEVNASLHIVWESSFAGLTLGNTVSHGRRGENGVGLFVHASAANDFGVCAACRPSNKNLVAHHKAVRPGLGWGLRHMWVCDPLFGWHPLSSSDPIVHVSHVS